MFIYQIFTGITLFLYICFNKHIFPNLFSGVRQNHDMATFKKRGKRWQAQVFKNGVRRAKSFPFKSDAVEWAREQENKLTEAGSVQDAFTRYIAEECPKHKGCRWETVRLKRMAPEFPAVRFCDLTASHIATWRNKRLQTVQGASVNREMTLLSQVVNIALHEWGWLKENPLIGVKKPPNSKPRKRGVSDKEITAITTALGYQRDCKVRLKKHEVAVAFLLAIETAMRLSELLNITWEYVDTANKIVKLVDSKNGDTRKVPLSPEAIRLISQLPKVKRDINIPINQTKIFSVESGVATSTFIKAKIQAGFNDVHFHDSRSEGLTRLSKKLSVIELARVVGHRSLASLMIYYSPSIEDLAKKLE